MPEHKLIIETDLSEYVEDSHICCCSRQNMSLCGLDRTGVDRTKEDIAVMCVDCISVDETQKQCYYKVCMVRD